MRAEISRYVDALCGYCGAEVQGTRRMCVVRPHSEQRVRMGANGQPEIYKAGRCPGGNQPGERKPAQPSAPAHTPIFQAPQGIEA